jgi:tripartite-type tricarboxylate transporter receptor subunit TctC
LYRFLAIAVLLDVKDIPQVGPLQWGWISTPLEIVGKLNQAVNAVLADPKLQARLAELGGELMPMTPAEFGKLVAEETEKWAKVIRAANIKPE